MEDGILLTSNYEKLNRIHGTYENEEIKKRIEWRVLKIWKKLDYVYELIYHIRQ